MANEKWQMRNGKWQRKVMPIVKKQEYSKLWWNVSQAWRLDPVGLLEIYSRIIKYLSEDMKF